VLFARAVFAALVAALFTGLTPTVFADQPDPTWTAGYWDDDDFDDAIVFLMALAAIDALTPVSQAPLLVPLARLHPTDPVERPAPLRAAVSARAPPLAVPSSC